MWTPSWLGGWAIQAGLQRNSGEAPKLEIFENLEKLNENLKIT